MKINNNELNGALLRWAVATCEGYRNLRVGGFSNQLIMDPPRVEFGAVAFEDLLFEVEWGDILARENISLQRPVEMRGCLVVGFHSWRAMHPKNYGGLIRYSGVGETAREAVLRCYVASRLGQEIEVPDLLLDGCPA